MQRSSKLFTAVLLALVTSHALAAGVTRHVVLVVWDGMRPDFVTEKHTPVLYGLSKRGVTFDNHHPVYVSSTEVNATALATGQYPERSGVIGNNEFRPDINPLTSIMTGDFAPIAKGDALTGGHFLNYPTVPEILHQQHLATVVAGAKPVAVLWDRHAENKEDPNIDLFEGHVLPESDQAALTTALGPFPPAAVPKIARDRWTTDALIQQFWKDNVPPFSVLWLSEPDNTQHATGPGSATALAALESSDHNLGRVLQVLNEKHLAETTDVIVVSDHGFSTIRQNVNIAADLKSHGFHAARSFPAPGPQPGDVLLVGNGGCVFLYVAGHDSELITKLVRFIQTRPYSGVVLTKAPLPGTFSLEDARIASANAPDIVLSLRWNDKRSPTGAPGELFCDAPPSSTNRGTHASLSRFDLHNTCIAAGPDFRRDFHDKLPTGNVDIAPTVLSILGVVPERKLSGRVLNEALVASSAPAPKVEHKRMEASWRSNGVGWKQYLKFSEVDGVRYLDEGNGEGN